MNNIVFCKIIFTFLKYLTLSLIHIAYIQKDNVRTSAKMFISTETCLHLGEKYT